MIYQNRSTKIYYKLRKPLNIGTLIWSSGELYTHTSTKQHQRCFCQHQICTAIVHKSNSKRWRIITTYRKERKSMSKGILRQEESNKCSHLCAMNWHACTGERRRSPGPRTGLCAARTFNKDLDLCDGIRMRLEAAVWFLSNTKRWEGNFDKRNTRRSLPVHFIRRLSPWTEHSLPLTQWHLPSLVLYDRI